MIYVNNIIEFYKISVFSICETWLDCTINNDALFCHPNFNIHRLDRQHKKGGGLICLVRKNFDSEISNFILSEHVEILHVTIFLKSSKPLHVISIYRSPKFSYHFGIDILSNFLRDIDLKNSYLIILGDFNIDLLKEKCNSLFNRFVKDYNFCVVNRTNPTRSSIQSTLIDLTLTNEISKGKLFNYQVLPEGISDHDLILFNFKVGLQPLIPNEPSIVPNINKTNTNEFILKCSNVIKDYKESLDQTGRGNVALNKIINAVSMFPKKTIVLKRHHHSWINKSFVALNKQKLKLYKAARLSKNNSDIAAAHKMRNKCNSLSHKLKKEYFAKLFQNSDPKNGWKVLSNFLPKKGSNNKNVFLVVDSCKIDKAPDVCKHFASFFRDKVTKIIEQNYSSDHVKNILSTTYVDEIKMQHPTCSVFSFTPVERKSSCIFPALINDSKSNPRSLPKVFYDLCPESFDDFIFNCICDSLSHGLYPKYLKHSIILPVYKSGSTYDVANYRPISIIPNIAKMFEKVVSVQVKDFISKEGFLYKFQSGFRKYHSTSTCMIDILSDFYLAFDNDCFVLSIFLDFSSAFDTISIDLLILKLKHLFNFDDTSLSWFSSYLKDRQSQVLYNGNLSETFRSDVGVPQGSILGPLLFSLFINDLPACVKNSKTVLFADDTTIYITGKDLNALFNLIYSDFLSILTYCKNNLLVLNTKKSKYMVFHKSSKLPIYTDCLNRFGLSKVDSITYLGYKLDQNLRCHLIIDHVCDKLNTCAAVLSKLSNTLPRFILRRIFYCIGVSHIFYNLDFIFSSSSYLKTRLSVSYNSCCRSIFGIKRSSRFSNNELLKALNLPSFLSIIDDGYLTFISKCVKKSCPSYICDSFFNLNARTLNFHVPRVVSNFGKRSFAFRGPSFWNKLDLNVRSKILKIKL